MSILNQCGLLELARSTFYYQPRGENAYNMALMRRIDEQFTKRPFYGVLRMTAWLRATGHLVNEKRVRRLMRRMGLYALPSGSPRKIPILCLLGGQALRTFHRRPQGQHISYKY